MRFRELFDVDIYLKSGNVLHLTGLRSFEIYTGKVTWESSSLKNRLIEVRPEQIEAVIQVRNYKRLSFK